MRSPAVATAWELWRPHRWPLTGGLVYFAVVSILCHVMPRNLYYDEAAIILWASFAVLAPLYLLAMFTYAPMSDLESSESLFPKRRFTLPIKTSALVGWPMLYGTVTIVVVWLAMAGLILRPRGLDVPVGRLGLTFAAALAWLQALLWSPFGLRWLRLIATVLLICFGVVLTGIMVSIGSFSWILVIVLGLQLPLAYAVAVWGVSLARRGDGPDYQRLIEPVRRALSRLRRHEAPFASAAEAQDWLEWRLRGWGLPLLIGCLTPLYILIIAIARNIDFGTPFQTPFQTFVILIQTPAILLCFPLLVAAFSGTDYGELVAANGDRRLTDFLATRPMSDEGFVRAKFRMAARSAVVIYVLMFVITGLTYLLVGACGEAVDTWRWLAERFSPLEANLIVLLAGVGMVVAAWLLMIENMLFALAGRKWFIPVIALTLFLLFVAAFLLDSRLYDVPEPRQIFWRLAAWLIPTAVAAKLLLATWAFLALDRRRLVGRGTMARVAAAWLGGVVGLFLVLVWLTPPDLVAWPFLAATAVLVLPLARIALAPLAVAWNRHH